MLAALAGLVLASAQGPIAKGTYLPDPDGGESKVLLHIALERLEVSKTAPKYPDWIFDWVTSVLCDPAGEPRQYGLRFRVFAQERREQNDKAERVGRLLGRLWEYNHFKLSRDHATGYNSRIVDVYICYGGEPGGEQMFGEDISGDNRLIRVNTIYIYALDSFKDPVEMAREVCHEYGHATLPPIGGFETPEDWGNGFLGEKLFMRWLRDDLAKGRLTPVDAMGADAEGLDAWVVKNVDPLVIAAAAAGPSKSVLSKKGQAALDAYIGLACYVESVFPRRVFDRSLQLIGSTKAEDYPAGVVLAAEEPDAYDLTIPALLKGKPLWVPLGKGKLSGAKVLQKRGDWVQVQPDAAGKVRVVNRVSD